MFRPRDQNVPGKIGDASPAGYTHATKMSQERLAMQVLLVTPTRKRPRADQ